MTFKKKHEDLEQNTLIMKWYRNICNGSKITGDVYKRTLGLYLKLNGKTPEQLIEDARKGKLRFDFMDFRDKLLQDGKAGSYVNRFKKVLNSWITFNGLDSNLSSVKIAGSNLSPTLENEMKPQREEIEAILRNASIRGRAIIGLLAFSGLRPESLGNYDGSDGIRIKDIEGLKIGPESIEYDQKCTTAMLRIRQSRVQLSKKGHRYFTFIPAQSLKYVKDYLDFRIREGEILNADSPIIAKDPRGRNSKDSQFLSTLFLERDIRYAIRKSGLKFRPYVLRVYWASCMDTAEAKGKVSHNWREFWMGHQGDISARYSTNKQLDNDTIENMREAYKACEKFLVTEFAGSSEEDMAMFVKKSMLQIAGFTDKEIETMDLTEIDVSARIKEKLSGTGQEVLKPNSLGQVIVRQDKVPEFFEKGYGFISNIGNGQVIMKVPN